MRRSLLALVVSMPLVGCYSFDLPATGGAGGSTSSSVGSTTSASTSVASSSVSDSASSSSGAALDPLYVYKRGVPLDGSTWVRRSFAEEFGTDPNVPKDGIVAAVKLQKQPELMLLTSDQMIHRRSNGVWSTVPIDTLFPPPAGACTRDNQCTGDCTGVGAPACAAVSGTVVTQMSHIPQFGGNCDTGGSNEDILLLGPTIATIYRMPASGPVTFVVQRDYKQDCYCDDFATTVDPIWDFEIWEPNNCNIQPPDPTWRQTYTRTTDGLLRYTTGTGIEKWTDAMNGNPLFGAHAEGDIPDPAAVVAAYFDQGAASKTGNIVLIAPPVPR